MRNRNCNCTHRLTNLGMRFFRLIHELVSLFLVYFQCLQEREKPLHQECILSHFIYGFILENQHFYNPNYSQHFYNPSLNWRSRAPKSSAFHCFGFTYSLIKSGTEDSQLLIDLGTGLPRLFESLWLPLLFLLNTTIVLSQNIRTTVGQRIVAIKLWLIIWIVLGMGDQRPQTSWYYQVNKLVKQV